MNLKIIFVVAMLLPGLYEVAGAQDAATPPTAPPVEAGAPAASPAVPVAPQKFYLEVDQADLTAISTALAELPKRIADPLILKLNAQLQAQAPITEAKATAEKARKGKK